MGYNFLENWFSMLNYDSDKDSTWKWPVWDGEEGLVPSLEQGCKIKLIMILEA